jgi:hypothetical protein
MRWSIIFLVALSLACSKKQGATPAEPEPAVEPEAPAGDKPSEAAEILANPATATGFNLEDLPPLPAALQGQAPLLDTPPLVTVLEQGTEPRQKLRWSVEPGFEQKLAVELGVAVDAVIVLIRSNMPMTVSSYDLTMQAKKVRKDGTVQVGFKVTGVHVVPQGGEASTQTEAQKLAMQERAKVVGSYTLSPHGGISDFEVANASDGTPAAPGLVDLLRWGLGQMTPALPAEPVGAGAKWTVHHSILQGGILVNQLRTIELVKLDGNRVELAVEVRQSATPQPYTNPMTGAKFELESLHGIASGALGWDFGQLAPLTATIHADGLDGAIYRNEDQTRKAGVAVHTERTVSVGGTK